MSVLGESVGQESVESEPVPVMRAPLMREVAEVLADVYGVCRRPVAKRRVNPLTGQSEVIAMPCGSRRESVCNSCAVKILKVRRWQAIEGWHLTEEPDLEVREPTVA